MATRPPLLDLHAAPAGGRVTPRWIVYLLIVGILLADWLTPAGIVVGILLAVPILLASGGNRPWEVVLATATALVGFVVAALFGHGPLSPRAVWLPNRLFVIVTIVASCPVALRLQRQRLQAEAARRAAESSRDLSRLLHSLMAHDLRAPLSVAVQAIEVARSPMSATDPSLLEDAETGLQRALESVDRVLAATRAALADPLEPPGTVDAPGLGPAAEIAAIAAGFEDAAARRGQRIETDLARVSDDATVNAPALRQVLSILLDNAVRHASPGTIRVSARFQAGDLRVSVGDAGPGFSRIREDPGAAGRGAGLGLRLAHLLVARASGTLTLERDEPSGSEFLLSLPLLGVSPRARAFRR